MSILSVGPFQTDATRSKKSKESKMVSRDSARTKKSKETERTKRSKDTEATKKLNDNVQMMNRLTKPRAVTLFLGLEDMNKVSAEVVPELTPCFSHFVYVAQSRDIPLDPNDVKPPLARWKLFRWLEWAISEGTIDPVEYFVPIRSLKIVSPLRKYEESVINRFNGTFNDTNEKSQRTKSREKLKGPQNQVSQPLELREDISFWADFNKLEPFIKDVHFFYKLDYFPYTTKLSDRIATKPLNDQKSETKKGSKKSSRKSSPSKSTFKDPDFVDAYCWPRKMTLTRNEPLYLFTDSLEEKFFLIDFSTFQVSVDSFEETHNDGTTYSKCILKGNEDYLVVEKHNWFRRPKKSDYLVSVSTAGTKSTVLEIDRGRHLLRVYCRSESDCFVTISSDTIFHVGDRRRMYELMCTESETVDRMARLLSNAIGGVCQAFGTERYFEAMKIYYNSYLPPAEERKGKNKLIYDQIHDYFVNEEARLIKTIVRADEVPGMVRSLKILFLNPAIGLEQSDATSKIMANLRALSAMKNGSEGSGRDSRHFEGSAHTIQQSVDRILEENNAASIIQSFFKMIVLKRYRKIHNPAHEEHDQVSRSLLKVAELFNYNKRESLINQVLRNVLKRYDKLYDVYHCFRDFEYTLQAQELKSASTNVRANQWLPIVRLVVNPRVAETVLAAIDLFVNLTRYSVRVFENETGREMLRVVNNVVPTRYSHSKLGYTIFCYAWSEDQPLKQLPWSLNVITMKGQPSFQFLDNGEPLSTIPVPSILIVDELSDAYIPNPRNIICKWIVQVTKPCLVSFRLRVSYEKARMAIKVTDRQGETLSRVKGTYVVILPMVYLGLEREPVANLLPVKKSSNNDKTDENTKDNFSDEKGDGIESTRKVYHVEASVLDDSWPLTRREWSCVTEFRVKPTGSLSRTKVPPFSNTGKLSKSESVRSRRGSKHSVDSTGTLESPYWVLQVVTDPHSELEISRDRTKEIEIARMKEAWAKENPDSLQRGKELREAFVKEHEIKPETRTGSIERKPSSHSKSSLTKRDTQRSSIDYASETSMLHLEERTLKPTASLRRLPPLDLTIYEVKEDEGKEPRLKTESDEELSRNIRAANIVRAEENYASFLDKLRNLFEKQQTQYGTLYGRYTEYFWDSRASLEEAYEARNLYVRRTKPVAASSTKSTKATKTTKKSTSKKSKKT
ncbi:androglobin [Xylocopa sonorina]|uniref:androglobin n=1 Tax=Xylocopa sonorina TaxID=1818115 RepID=UPI00403AB843